MREARWGQQCCQQSSSTPWAAMFNCTKRQLYQALPSHVLHMCLQPTMCDQLKTAVFPLTRKAQTRCPSLTHWEQIMFRISKRASDMAQKEEAIPKPDEQFDPWDPQWKEGSNSCMLSSEFCAYANTHKVKLNTEKSKILSTHTCRLTNTPYSCC